MTNWLATGNIVSYDHEASFAKNGYIDWEQPKGGYNIGDIVYIYHKDLEVKQRKGKGRVKFKTIVEISDMSYDETTDDKEFWNVYNNSKDPQKLYKKNPNKKYARLKLIDRVDNIQLSYDFLTKFGLDAQQLRKPKKLTGELEKYIIKFFDSNSKLTINNNDNENKSILEYYEGELVERTYLSKSRNRQIVEKVKTRDNHTCLACRFYFDNKAVEVHHLNPISETEAGIINIDDLVTLCPTCHTLAHILLKQDDIYKNKNILLNKLKEIHKI